MPVDNDLLLVLRSSGLGDGEPDLGEKLMASFLTVLLESGTAPARIVCMNSGVFLTTEGSPVADTLKKFLDQGTEILSCGTCLDYYGRSDRLIIGEASNMKAAVAAMLGFKRTLTP